MDRHFTQELLDAEAGKVHILLGPRRAGKTFILKDFFKKTKRNLLMLNGDDLDSHALLEPRTIKRYERLLSNTDGLILDEAQHVPDIGMKLKLMVDEFPDKYFFASGSSPLDLNQNSGEPLTGRRWVYSVFPPALFELSQTENLLELEGKLPERLLFGHYPEVLTTKSDAKKKQYLTAIRDEYLLKDLLILDGLKYSRQLYDLLRLLAFQIGGEVSLNELSKKLGWHKKTVADYIHLLQQVFVIFELSGFSRNLRKEIVKSSKYYFLDNGILNALLNNYQPMELRPNRGFFWENYVLAERFKFHKMKKTGREMHFWRTYDKQEIDLIETADDGIFAYEVKWNPERKVKTPAAFSKAYPDATFEIIHPKNYLEWLT